MQYDVNIKQSIQRQEPLSCFKYRHRSYPPADPTKYASVIKSVAGRIHQPRTRKSTYMSNSTASSFIQRGEGNVKISRNILNSTNYFSLFNHNSIKGVLTLSETSLFLYTKIRGSNLEGGLKGFENVVKRTSNGVYRSPRRLAVTKHPMNPGGSSITSL